MKEQSPIVPRLTTVVQHWKASPIGVYKINWDVAIDKSRKLMGVGVIVRDGVGKVVVALHASQMNLLDPTLAKAYVVWKAI